MGIIANVVEEEQQRPEQQQQGEERFLDALLFQKRLRTEPCDPAEKQQLDFKPDFPADLRKLTVHLCLSVAGKQVENEHQKGQHQRRRAAEPEHLQRKQLTGRV